MVNYTRDSKNFYACFNHFDIKHSIAQITRTYASLDSPAHKKYNNIFVWHPYSKQNKGSRCLFTMQ